MRSKPEAEVTNLAACDVEALGIGNGGLVAIGRRIEQSDSRAWRNVDSRNFGRRRRGPGEALR
ncbi:hypothetical protein XI09_07075 [Bradyrhizobium sp. CCBAU 11386]|nr:hypothetical protein [Bradyrhizobium sp. CCBAU 11386]